MRESFELWPQNRKKPPMCGVGADGSWQREPSASAKDLTYRRKLSVLEKGQFIAGKGVR